MPVLLPSPKNVGVSEKIIRVNLVFNDSKEQCDFHSTAVVHAVVLEALIHHDATFDAEAQKKGLWRVERARYTEYTYSGVEIMTLGGAKIPDDGTSTFQAPLHIAYSLKSGNSQGG